jgi:hypothetical protein
MVGKRSGPVPDRILVAWLTAAAQRLAGWQKMAGEERAAAVAELRQLAGRRSDLLAEVAGLAEGFAEGTIEYPHAKAAADLCREAGADLAAIPSWIEVGRQRAAKTRMPPLSGGMQGGGAHATPRP